MEYSGYMIKRNQQEPDAYKTTGWTAAVRDMKVAETITIEPLSAPECRSLRSIISRNNTAELWGAGVFVTTRARYDKEHDFYKMWLTKKQEGK